MTVKKLPVLKASDRGLHEFLKPIEVEGDEIPQDLQQIEDQET